MRTSNIYAPIGAPEGGNQIRSTSDRVDGDSGGSKTLTSRNRAEVARTTPVAGTAVSASTGDIGRDISTAARTIPLRAMV
jgi:hypothetical protein